MEILADVLLLTRIHLIISQRDDLDRMKKDISALLGNEYFSHYLNLTSKVILLFTYWKIFPVELFFENEKIKSLLTKLDSDDVMVVYETLKGRPDFLKKFIASVDSLPSRGLTTSAATQMRCD